MKQVRQAPERATVLTGAVLRAAEYMGLTRGELAAVLGLSTASLSRMHAGAYVLDEKSKQWELAALLVRLYRGLDAIMAGDERALRAWLRNPNADLREAPAQLIAGVAGLAEVVAYVDAHRARL